MCKLHLYMLAWQKRSVKRSEGRSSVLPGHWIWIESSCLTSKSDLISNPPPSNRNSRRLLLNIVSSSFLKAVIMCCTFAQSYFKCCLWSEAGAEPDSDFSFYNFSWKFNVPQKICRHKNAERGGGRAAVCTLQRDRIQSECCKNQTKIRRLLRVWNVWL